MTRQCQESNRQEEKEEEKKKKKKKKKKQLTSKCVTYVSSVFTYS